MEFLRICRFSVFCQLAIRLIAWSKGKSAAAKAATAPVIFYTAEQVVANPGQDPHQVAHTQHIHVQQFHDVMQELGKFQAVEP